LSAIGVTADKAPGNAHYKVMATETILSIAMRNRRSAHCAVL